MKQEHKLNYRMEKLEGDTHKLFLYDEIASVGEFDWNTWEYKDSETSAKNVKALLDEIPANSTIEVHLNSRGGEVSEGTAIYNLLRQKSQNDDCLIIGYVDGYAYSIAMTIAMACDEIHMGLGTSMLIHNPWTFAMGNADELRAEADRMDALALSSRQLYLNRAKNLTEEELKDMMDKETLLDPESCLKYGFCDVIDKYENEEQKGAPKQSVNDELIELRRQLKEQAFTKSEVEKMLKGLKMPRAEPKQEAGEEGSPAEEALEEPAAEEVQPKEAEPEAAPAPEEPKEEVTKQLNIKNTLITAFNQWK